MRLYESTVKNYRCSQCRTLHFRGWPDPNRPCCDHDGNPLDHSED